VDVDVVAHPYSVARHEFAEYTRPPFTPTIAKSGELGRLLEHCG
jgi:hypothetical protein